MKWNRKRLLTAAKEAGYTGAEDLAALKAWMETKNIGFSAADGTDNEVDVDRVWAKKTVTVSISADAGEDVQVVDANEPVTESMDEDEEEGEIPTPKRRRVTAQDVAKAMGGMGSQPARDRSTKGVRDLTLATHKKAYNRAVASNGTFKGKRPVFSDADEAEYFGAGMRLASAGHKAYSQRARDLEIIGQKAGSTLDNTYAGVLVVHETAPQIIDLLHTFGATRQLVPVTPMRDGEMRVNRKTANMAFGFEGESEEIPETNPTLDQVRLVANKLAGIGRVSNELLDDSAFDIADLVATSSAAGLSKAEDDAYFFGTGLANFTGLAGKIDTPSTYDAALASNWGDVTVDQIEEWIGLVPIEAWRSGTVKIACSHRFFRTVLNRFAVGAGGNTGEQILGGFGPATQYGGIPVVLTEVLPSTYVADQKAAYIGSFERGTKMGVVTGSEQIDASDQAYWKFDQYAWRVKERIAFNIHDVGGADSEVIAFQS